MYSVTEARKIFSDLAADDLLQEVDAVEAAGLGKWSLDPIFDNVVVFHDEERVAMVVVYAADEDFEVSPLLDRLYQTLNN